MSKHSTYLKFFLAIIISAALTACGGGSSDTNAPTSPTSNTVNGTISKGIIFGGIVNAYLITANGEKGGLVAGPVTTSATNGSYTLPLGDSYTGNPLIIEITSADTGSTQMKCDLVTCETNDNGDTTVGFGDTYTLPANFSLQAVTGGSADSTLSINVTPMTDVAAALTLQKIASGADPAAAAIATNAQIANKFGIDYDLTGQPVIDITNPEAINTANAEVLEYNIKSAAIVQAALNTHSGTLEEALEEFVDQYVRAGGVADNDGTGDTNNPAMVSLEEILTAAGSLLESVRALEGINSSNAALISVISGIETEKAAADESENTTPDQGEIPDDIGSEGLVASKKFVQQMRDFVNATSENLATLEAFGAEINMAADITSEDTSLAFEGLARSMVVIVEAYLAFDEDNSLESYAMDGITVTINSTGSTPVFSVNQDVSVMDQTVSVELAASADVNNAITETDQSQSGELTADFAITGNAATDEVNIAIGESSGFSGDLTVDNMESESGTYAEDSGTYTSDESNALKLTDLALSLDVTIGQKAIAQITDPASFTGQLSADIGLIDYSLQENTDSEWTSTETSGTGNSSTSETEKARIDDMSLTLSGEFSNSTENLSASATLAANGLGGICTFEYSYIYSYDFGSGDSEYTESQTDDCITNETETDYAAAALTVIFDVDINGITDPTRVQATIKRTGVETGEIALDITYGGNQLSLAYAGGDNMTITNHNGVMLTLVESESDLGESMISGSIKHEGAEYATIDGNADIPRITFIDGYFESLY